MKIEVGKFYKANDGHDWFIECQLSKHNADFRFVATAVAKTGRVMSAYFDSNGSTCARGIQLEPNKIKRTAWAVVIKKHGNLVGNYYSTNQTALYGTHSLAEACKGSGVVVELNWEEEA